MLGTMSDFQRLLEGQAARWWGHPRTRGGDECERAVEHENLARGEEKGEVHGDLEAEKKKSDGAVVIMRVMDPDAAARQKTPA